MRTVDLRSNTNNDASVYYFTYDDDLIHESDMFASDEPRIKVLSDPFCGVCIDEYENSILDQLNSILI
jgi:hypothetical protein